MTPASFALILVSVSLSAVAQTLFKAGVSRVTFAPEASVLIRGLGMVMSPYVLAGLACYGFGTVLWLFALRNLDLSLAYPFVAMSFVMVVLSGIFVLGEPAQTTRLVGTGLIILGLFIMAKGS